jgi:hypothetical protein
MNAIQEIHSKLVERFPALRVLMDEPENERGDWFLDILIDSGSRRTIPGRRPGRFGPDR